MEARGYQVEIAARAAEILKAHGLVYLAMETRTGKTLTALLALQQLGVNTVLFVTKKKAISSILSDYSAGNWNYLLEVINYEQLHKVRKHYQAYVIDEAHTLGAFPKPSKRTKILKQLVGSSPVIYLSATPTPESLSQIYHQFWISYHSPFAGYKTFYHWARNYVNIKQIYVYNNTVNDYSCAIKDKVMPVISPYFLTLTQEDAGIVETIKEHVITCQMPESLIDMIKSLNRKRIITLPEGQTVIADTAVKLMGKTHQMCSGTVIADGDRLVELSDFKAQKIRQLFDGKDIAIFYKYKGERSILLKVFPDATENVQDFLANGGVFIGQFQSAREGVRLDRAKAIIFYSIDFSFLSYEQAKNRIVSYERTEPATLYWCFSDFGIERKIYEVVKNKQDFTTIHYRKLWQSEILNASLAR